jgi:hypothetical protein
VIAVTTVIAVIAMTRPAREVRPVGSGPPVAP